MKEYQERDDLDEKMARLSDYMNSDSYAKLPAVEQGLLMVQITAMQNYSSVLFRRIELFT